MLRVSRISESSRQTVLKVEGRIVAQSVEALEQECRQLAEPDRRVVLDFSDVNYVDGQAARVLRGLTAGRVAIINCSPLLEGLLAEAS